MHPTFIGFITSAPGLPVLLACLAILAFEVWCFGRGKR